MSDVARTSALRVLAADENKQSLQTLVEILEGLGHEVTALAVSVSEAAEEVAAQEPELAFVKLHGDDEHALELIDELGEYASGPVIALLEVEDVEFVAQAAERGIFAYVQPLTAERIQAAIEIATRRQAEAAELEERVEQLETALVRRTTIERAKGILMERHGISEREAFELLRQHARANRRTVVDVARAVTEGHALLPS